MKFLLKHFGKIVAECPLEEGREYFVGRHKDCDFILIEETGLSRKHIKIYPSAETGNWLVESISELGGLYLEGEEIKSAELESSCSFALRNYTLEFIKIEEEPVIQEKSISEKNIVLSGSEELSLEQTNYEGETKMHSTSNLVYSLHVSIDGEFCDHISLNEGDTWVIGRSEKCDISIDYSILTRKHLQILKRDGIFYVKDLGSANKTFLNNQELEPQKEILLKSNDEISVSELKILFEVRNRNFEKMMSQLPANVSEEEAEEEHAEMALSKVVLEDVPEETAVIKTSGWLNKKKVFLLAVLVIIGFVSYFKHIEQQKNMKKEAELQKSLALKERLNTLYNMVITKIDSGQYKECLDQLVELHSESPTNYFRDSQQLFARCQNALESKKRKEEYLAQEKERLENELKIKTIADKCKAEFAAKKIKTVEELNQCAAELLGGLDPANADITAIQMEIEHKESLKLLAQQKKESYQKMIRSKKSLYYKAKKIADQNKPLKAVVAYNVFLKSSRKVSALNELYKQAESERDAIQNTYDGKLKALHDSCENLIQNKKMKEAYYDCKEVLYFKSNDKKAVEYMKLAKTTLQKQFKSIYEESMTAESFSQIEKAKKIWNEILAKDIKDGYYYKKAVFQLNKYK